MLCYVSQRNSLTVDKLFISMHAYQIRFYDSKFNRHQHRFMVTLDYLKIILILKIRITLPNFSCSGGVLYLEVANTIK